MTDLERFKSVALCRALALDTETTGFGHKAEMLSCAFVGLDELEKPELMFEILVQPEVATEWYYAQKVNHISPEDVKDCKTLHTYGGSISNLVKDSPLLAWNMKFDRPFFKGYTDTASDHICLMRAYTEFKGRKKVTNIKTAAEELGIAFDTDSAHDAVYDATVLMQIAVKLSSLLEDS